MPEPKGLHQIIKLKYKDIHVSKLWCNSIWSEVKNLVEKSTFGLENPKNNEHIIPTTFIFKIQLQTDGSWDKAKARCCVREDIQKKILQKTHGQLQLQKNISAPTS